MPQNKKCGAAFLRQNTGENLKQNAGVGLNKVLICVCICLIIVGIIVTCFFINSKEQIINPLYELSSGENDNVNKIDIDSCINAVSEETHSNLQKMNNREKLYDSEELLNIEGKVYVSQQNDDVYTEIWIIKESSENSNQEIFEKFEKRVNSDEKDILDEKIRETFSSKENIVLKKYLDFTTVVVSPKANEINSALETKINEMYNNLNESAKGEDYILTDTDQTFSIGTSYSLTNATKTFSITKANGYINLTSSSGTVPYGTSTATFDVSSYHGGTLSVTEKTTTIANVSVSGTRITISNLDTLSVGTNVVVRVTSEANNNYSSASAEYTLTIVKAKITPTVNMTSYTYAGRKNDPTVNGNLGGGTETFYYTKSNASSGGTDWKTVTSSTSLDAGTYYMYVVVGESAKYSEATSAPKQFEIFKADITGSVIVKGTNKYQSELEAVVNVLPNDCTLEYQWYYNDSSSTTGGTAIQGATSKKYTVGPESVGKYIYVVVTAKKENYNTKTLTDITDKETNGNATAAKIQLKKPALTGTYIYNGKTQTVTVTNVFDTNQMNINGNTGIDANTYTVTISLKNPNSYEWEGGGTTDLKYTWTIEKKQVTAVWGPQTTFVYNGEQQAPTVTAESGVEGETLVLSRTTETNAGKYISEAKIDSVIGGQAKVENYTLISNTKSYEITKATGKFEITKPEDNPEKSEGKGIIDGDNIGREENGVITYTYKVTVVEGNSINIKYNYNGDVNGEVQVDMTKATITLAQDSFIVKGVQDGTVIGIITFAGSQNYKDVKVTMDITVLRANYKIEKDGNVTNYNKLKDAVDHAENEDTITVLQDVVEEDSSEVHVNKNLTLDLQNKHVIRDNKVVVELGAKLKIVGEEKEGKKGTLENTEGPAVENKGTLELGENKERDIEDNPVLKGKNKAIETEEGEFRFESGTLVGKNEPPYDGRPKTPIGYYIETTKETDGLNYSKLLKDTFPPEIYADYINEMKITTRDELSIFVNVKEKGSGLDPNEFTKEDLIFEIDGEKVNPEVLELMYMGKNEEGIYRYSLKFERIPKAGELTIRVETNKVYDIARLGNVATIITEGKIIVVEDITPPDLSDIDLKLIEPEDGITDTGDYEVEVKGAKDDNEITEYQWEIRKKGDTEWEVVGREEAGEEGSHYSGHFDEEGEYEIRVRVSDKSRNHSYSRSVIVIYTTNKNYNSRPTISFEKEVKRTNNEVTGVLIKATIKSSTEIVMIKVNGNKITSASSTLVQEGVYQIRTDVEYEALVNTSYKFEVTDSQGNITSEICNVSEINRKAANVKYKVVDASLSENAKIIFTSNEEVVLLDNLPIGYTADDKYKNIYQKEIVVKVPVGIKRIEETFVFVDRVGNETRVTVNEDVETKVRYIRTISKITKKLTEIYGESIKLEKAMNLVSKMKGAQEQKNGKVISYYGVDSTEINMLVSSEEDLDIARTLGSANEIQVSTSEGLESLSKGTSEIITKLESGMLNSTNGNMTGVMIRESNLIVRDKDEEGNSFHITIINK